MKVSLGALILELGLVLGASCGRAEPSASPEAFVSGPQQGLPGFARRDARLFVAHSGTRRLDFAPIAGQGISLRERITTDGQGRFSIEALALLESSTLDWEAFAMFQQARGGFHFRYRDFRVHDPVLFARNWRTTSLGTAAPIAGRSCERFRIERAIGEPVSYEICADTDTGLVLSSEQYDAAGELVASMTYESFELDPALGGVAWHQPSNAERPLDVRSEPSVQLGSRVLAPRLLPTGYAREEAALVAEDGVTDWLKLTYSDGIQPLFFLQALRTNTGAGATPSASRAAGEPSASSRVVTFQVGAATVIQGEVEGHDLIVIGMAPEAEMLDMIESSLP